MLKTAASQYLHEPNSRDKEYEENKNCSNDHRETRVSTHGCLRVFVYEKRSMVAEHILGPVLYAGSASGSGTDVYGLAEKRA